MADDQKDTGNDVKTAQEVLKMSGNDQMKFGVLIGLIKVGQVSNRDVVDTVLNLVGFNAQNEVLNNLLNCIFMLIKRILLSLPLRLFKHMIGV